MKLSIYPSSVEASRKLILHIINIMNEEPVKTFNIGLSGGQTPALMFDIWANEYSNVTPWERMRIFWVDERCVPPTDSDSNYGMICSLLLSLVPIPYENVFRIYGEMKSPNKEAKRYSELVEQLVPDKDGFPEFDIILLGAGVDGHTSSIFPGQEKFLNADAAYVTTVNPINGQKRIAMTGNVIINARWTIFLITGGSKAEVVNEICYSGDVSPAAYVAHHAKNVELFLDEVAILNPSEK
ncbi:6-phosphogluconolactonase [Bacteroides sp.]|uniref:6-phosphogluconolactonase n=1 Tax=Bacteroides sp. TaxID=29523 RepID=UPI0026344872|nr:6-phosphogluconolactonase [Bacteroides sp.]MDD3038894.1 6-phosphogluconolactonase [Bacteroides sp.]